MKDAKTDVQPLAVSIEQAARILGVCRRTVYNMMADETIRAVRFRRRVLVPVAQLQRLVAQNTPETR